MDAADLDALWDFDDPSATELRFRALLEDEGRVGGAPRLELMTQLARTLSLQRRFVESHAVLDQVEADPSASTGRARVRLLLERGRALNSAGRSADARPRFLEAWEFGRALREDTLAVDAAHMLGIVETGERSLHWNEIAIQVATQSTDARARAWLGSLCNNTGWTYHDLGRHEEALAMFRRALAAREEQGATGAIRIARWCVARCLRSLGQVDEALAMQRVLLAELESEGRADGFVFEEIGECLLLKGREVDAAPFFARAFEELSTDPDLMAKDAARLERLRGLGRPGADPPSPSG